LKTRQIRELDTEQPNRAARDLDLRSGLEIARIINREDRKVAAAVGRLLPKIARAIEIIAERLRKGGRLIYVGTGSSGRIAALDASECPPTFGVEPDKVQYLIAGGDRALGHAAEYGEDLRSNGVREIAARKVSRKDVVIGLAASGRTPYTLAAVEYAKRKGATTIAVTCNHGSALENLADLAIVVEVGPEVVSGSSRMKAGTAQKMVLNMLSTGAMARLGYVYGNRMVNVHTKNEKLRERGLGILQDLAGVSRGQAEILLRQSRNSVAVALVALTAHASAAVAAKALQKAGGNVRRAISLAKKLS